MMDDEERNEESYIHKSTNDRDWMRPKCYRIAR